MLDEAPCLALGFVGGPIRSNACHDGGGVLVVESPDVVVQCRVPSPAAEPIKFLRTWESSDPSAGGVRGQLAVQGTPLWQQPSIEAFDEILLGQAAGLKCCERHSVLRPQSVDALVEALQVRPCRLDLRCSAGARRNCALRRCPGGLYVWQPSLCSPSWALAGAGVCPP